MLTLILVEGLFMAQPDAVNPAVQANVGAGAPPAVIPPGPAMQDAPHGDQVANQVAVPAFAGAANPANAELPDNINVVPLNPPHNPPIPDVQNVAAAAQVAPGPVVPPFPAPGGAAAFVVPVAHVVPPGGAHAAGGGAPLVVPAPVAHVAHVVPPGGAHVAAAPVVPVVPVAHVIPAPGAPAAPVAAAAAAPAAAPIDVTHIQTAADAKNINPNLGGQDILKDLINDLKSQGDVVLSSKIETNPDGSYLVEPYTLPNDPATTYYKTKAIYTATVKDQNGQVVKDANGKDLVVKITRDIYTNGTTPEQCGVAASNLKNTIVGLAQAESGMDSRLFTQAEYQSLSATQRASLMAQRAFRFSFLTDANTGKITKLNEIIAEKDKTPSITMKLKPKPGRYVQQIEHAKHKKAKHLTQSPGPAVGGKVVFSTKEEALQHARYTVKDANIFDSLKTGRITFDGLKEELEKKEKELSSLKDNFKAAGFLGLWKSKSRDPALTQFLELSKVQKLLQHNQPLPQTLSKEVSDYANDYLDLEDLRNGYGDRQQVQDALALMTKLKANNNAPLSHDETTLYNTIQGQTGAPAAVPGDINKEIENLYDFVNQYSQDINALEQGMHQIESTINADAAHYNYAMMELQKKNQEYENLYNQYKALKVAAKTPANQQSPDDIAIGNKIKSEVPKGFLKKMRDEIKANNDLIEEFKQELRVTIPLGAAEHIIHVH